MQLGSFFWNCVRVFRVRIYYYVTQWSATRFYGSLSVYNRPIPSEKIAPWQPSQSHRPAILVHFKAICFLWLLSFSIKIPEKSSGIQEEVMSLDFLTQASRGRACSLESKRSPAENDRSALISLERWWKATVRCPVVMMRTLWTVLTKICNVQFVMWLYEIRFWLDVAIDFVKMPGATHGEVRWTYHFVISFCRMVVKKKKLSQESKDIKKALLGEGFHFWLGGKHGHRIMHYNFLQFRKLHAILRS